MLLSSSKTMEVVMDYDYMVSVYEKVNGEGSYLSGKGIDKVYYPESNLLKSEYNRATDVMTLYSYQAVKVGDYIIGYEVSDTMTINYYKLKNTFREIAMKSAKFSEQDMFLVDENALRTYSKDGKIGLLYMLQQNILIDDITDSNEIEHLVNYFNDNNITGEFYLYIENQILTTGTGDNELAKIKSLFDSYLKSSNLKFEFELVSTTEKISNGTTSSKFNLTVTSK